MELTACTVHQYKALAVKSTSALTVSVPYMCKAAPLADYSQVNQVPSLKSLNQVRTKLLPKEVRRNVPTVSC